MPLLKPTLRHSQANIIIQLAILAREVLLAVLTFQARSLRPFPIIRGNSRRWDNHNTVRQVSRGCIQLHMVDHPVKFTDKVRLILSCTLAHRWDRGLTKRVSRYTDVLRLWIRHASSKDRWCTL